MSEPVANERDSVASCSGGSCAAGAWWRLPVVLALVLAGILLARSSAIREVTPPEDRASIPVGETEPTGQTVALSIQFGDGRERIFDAIAWHSGMTVDDALTAASRSTDAIRYVIVGHQDRALLTRIDDAANEGAGGRNWTYSVNGQRADRSLAIYELQPGDRILWTFGRPQ